VRYAEALAWLYSLQRFGIKLGLENIRRLIAELRIDLGRARVFHVAGTNGKGSVCAMIEAICRAAKYRTGLFTSPHLITFRERICVNGDMISRADVAAGLTKIRELVAEWDPHPTFFEVTTALALKYFGDTKLDVIILETGLGGRMDATNAVQSDVAVITAIELDHQRWLGNSIEEIASEKAGIIKPRVPVISAPQRTEVEAVLRKRATECDSEIQFVNQPDHTHAIGLLGAFQKQNATLAISALSKLDRNIRSSLPRDYFKIRELAIAHGLKIVRWPARFQKWDERTIIDGAHNVAAARALVETWRAVFPNQRATLILAVLSDKDLRGICEALLPIADSILLPKIRTERAVEPAELQKIFTDLGCDSEKTASFAEAFDKARKKSPPILVTGSLHFAGEALAHLQGEPAAFEECNQ
jgi:dihydrofolate synthase/folylpolyglutamate synthase